MTDRGAYRPGTKVHVNAAVRMVTGMDASALAETPLIVRVSNGSQSSPVAESLVSTSRFGFVHDVFDLPANAPLRHRLATGR